MAQKVTAKKGLRPEYVVALIGLLGIVFGATITNWDKLTSNVVSAEYSGYRPTGNFETEMRYFLEISGARAQMEDMNNQMMESMKAKLMQGGDVEEKEIDRMLSITKKNRYTFEESVHDLLPIWKKYFTIEQIQELNKFYSTPTMQNLVRVQPAITKEVMPIFVEKAIQKTEKMMEEFEKEFAAEEVE